MISRLRVKLSANEGERYGSLLSPVMQSILMETIDSVYAARMHQDSMHPYSQFISMTNNGLIWTVQTIGVEAKHHIIDPLLLDDFQKIELRDRDETLDIIGKSYEETSEDTLVSKYYLGECPFRLQIQFLSPTSFKSDGHYVIFPSTRLIFQSLMQKYDAYSDQTSIFSEEMLSEFEQNAFITDYRLRTTRFHIAFVRIPAFLGTVNIRLKGPQQFANIAWMLAAFGEYSGIGIKTGMGMGAMQIVREEQKRGTIRKKNG